MIVEVDIVAEEVLVETLMHQTNVSGSKVERKVFNLTKSYSSQESPLFSRDQKIAL